MKAHQSTPREKEIRVVLYSHDSQGLGHTRRNLAIAHALAATLPELSGRTVTGLLVTGESHAPRFDIPEGWDWVVLPGVRKGADGYIPRHLSIGQKKLVRLRSSLIDAVLAGFKPHLVIVDRHAFGIDGELKQALAGLRAARPACRVVLGLREVLDSPSVAKREWKNLGNLDSLASAFDALWVYGDPGFHDPVRTGEIPLQLSPLVRYSGYLSAGRVSRRRTSGARKPYLLTLAGGGSDGLDVLLTAARATLPETYEHLIITGPQMPKEHRVRIEQAAGPRTRVLGAVRDALAEIKEASAIVSMGGYNSVCEILSTSTPALIVPRISPRREQLIRAESLARHDLVDVCQPAEFTPAELSRWFSSVAGSDVDRSAVDLAGLEAVGGLAADLLQVRMSGVNRPLEDWTSCEAV
ncbi:glycosyltransferase [Arthrobacter sp. Br18]|uniref:glycosyltransferase family protein n=1 Tax=Arthrobacter sp. Br18 TaxID=1312954 RepID=UPI0004B9CEE7|nr:glycosyltransferase [Arthrobacter sp. Br18]